MDTRIFKHTDRRDLPFILAVAILGSLNHFLYDWTGGSSFAALFCPINESPWEHLKLLFFPFLFVTLGTAALYRFRDRRFFYCRFLGVLCGMAFILISFYTYTGIWGTHVLILDLLIFFLSVVLSFSAARHFCRTRKQIPSATLIFFLWGAGIFFFFAFTCFPPGIPLFFPYA